jgi:hypothetical protein
VLKEQCPAPLLTLFSFSAPQPDVITSGISETAAGALLALADVRKVYCTASSGAGDTDYKGVLDLLRISMQLVPNRRLLPETLVQFALFRRPAQVLSAATSGGRGRLEFRSNKLTLTGGAMADVTALTAKVWYLRSNMLPEMLLFLYSPWLCITASGSNHFPVHILANAESAAVHGGAGRHRADPPARARARRHREEGRLLHRYLG